MLWFAIGIVINLFGILNVVYPGVYEIPANLSLLFWIAMISSIFFYIINLKELLLVPITITLLVTLQIVFNVDIFFANLRIFQQTLSFVPIIGFLYLTIKKKDGKSFSFTVSLILSAVAGIILNINSYVSGTLSAIVGIVLVLGIFGIFDSIFEYRRNESTWIEQQMN
jgi:flagellar biosynthesis protein FliQ